MRPTGLPEGAGRPLAREPRHPGRSQPRRAGGGGRPPVLPRRRRLAGGDRRWPGAAALPTARAELLQLRVEPRSQAGRSRDWAAAAVGDPARSSDVRGWEARWRSGADVRRRRRLAGRLRVRPRGHRPRVASDGCRVPGRVCRRDRGAAPVADRRAARLHVLQRRPQPGWLPAAISAPLAVVYVASFACRSLPRMRSTARMREALRGYRDDLRGPAESASREGAHVGADDPRRPTPIM